MGLVSRLFGRTQSGEDGWVEVAELAALMRGASPPLVVDVRGPEEFAGPLGHIDGAVNVPLPGFGDVAAGLVADQRPVVLVCHTDRRSSAAAAMLRQAGKSDVSVLRGGMVAWQAAG